MILPHNLGGRSVGSRGMTLVEVLIGGFVLVLVFGGLFAGFQYSLALIAHTRAQSGAIALANMQMEYIRGLPYDDVGTVSGIPAGSIAQNVTVTLNNISYNRRTLIQYVDAPDDGSGGADSNGITADYKRAKVELTWNVKGATRSLALVSNIIPPGMETLAGGGTLLVNVFDAAATPVSGAAVRVVNATTTPTIDVTSFTDALGTVIFPGAPASGGYEIAATKAGYSTDQTYSASSSNPNPNPPHVSVVLGAVSTVNLAIDYVSTLALKTVRTPTARSIDDTFTDASGLFATTSAYVVSGDLLLTDSAGVFDSEGFASSTVVAPSSASLFGWVEAAWADTVPAQTELRYHIYSVDSSNNYTLVPDADIPGNSAGFTAGPVDLSTLTIAIYPRLALGAVLRSLDGTATPRVHEWEIEYLDADVPVPNIDITLTGTKNIGTDASAVPVPKYRKVHITNASGVVSVPNLEWDQYDVDINDQVEGFSIADSCPSVPFIIAPNTISTTTLVLAPYAIRSLRVHVLTATGAPIPDAAIRVTNGSYDVTQNSSVCGQAFFTGMPDDNYTIEVSKAGYTDATVSGYAISGVGSLAITLNP